jgi:hypothetical protein
VTTPGRAQQARPGARGCSSMAERQLPKLIVRVRFSSPAPATFLQVSTGIFGAAWFLTQAVVDLPCL